MTRCWSTITAMRSQIAVRLSRSCVTMNTVRPRLSLRSRTKLSNAVAAIGSSPAVGSSRNSSLGSSARARARPARLRMPPDSAAGIFPAVSGGKPTNAILSAAISCISAEDRSSCSRNGTMMFSATVSELNSAPSWNSTPHRLPKRRRSPRPARPSSSPKTAIVPAAGGVRPTIVRSRTDLPEPDAPTTPSTSPDRRSKVASCSRIRPPALVARPRTRTTAAAGSDPDRIEEDREECIEHDDQENGLDHGLRRAPPDAFGAAGHQKTLVATDESDAGGKEWRLDDTQKHAPQRYRAVQLREKRRQRNIERDPTDDGAAGKASEIGPKGQERQGQDQPEDARHHQNLDRIEAEGAHGVDFLVDDHGADFGSEGAARAPGDDDGGQQPAELAQKADGEKIDGEDQDRKSTRLNSSHPSISYAVF